MDLDLVSLRPPMVGRLQSTAQRFFSTVGSSRRQGISPGGVIQGIAVVDNGGVFAVSDQGGLYRVNNVLAPNPGNVELI